MCEHRCRTCRPLPLWTVRSSISPVRQEFGGRLRLNRRSDRALGIPMAGWNTMSSEPRRRWTKLASLRLCQRKCSDRVRKVRQEEKEVRRGGQRSDRGGKRSDGVDRGQAGSDRRQTWNWTDNGQTGTYKSGQTGSEGVSSERACQARSQTKPRHQ